jgi:ATP synthase I chain
MATEPQDESAVVVLRRIRRIAGVVWALFAVPVLVSSGWRGLIGLTCSGLVTMINFLWLEEIVDALLQPTPRRHPWRLTVRTLSRFALLGVALLVTIFVARMNAVSVLLGFSIVVAGIMGEAVYSTVRSFSE